MRRWLLLLLALPALFLWFGNGDFHVTVAGKTVRHWSLVPSAHFACAVPSESGGYAVGGCASFTSSCVVTTVTLNPNDKDALLTLSGGNLSASSSGSNPSANTAGRATVSFSTGKLYYEFQQTAGGASHFVAGWANGNFAMGNFLGNDANGGGQEYSPPGQFLLNGGFNNLDSAAPASGSGTWMGLAFDIGGGKVWQTHDGVNWNTAVGGAQNPGTGAGGFSTAALAAGPYFPAVSMGGDTVVDTGTVNYGGTAFAYSVPNGFTAVQSCH